MSKKGELVRVVPVSSFPLNESEQGLGQYYEDKHNRHHSEDSVMRQRGECVAEIRHDLRITSTSILKANQCFELVLQLL